MGENIDSLQMSQADTKSSQCLEWGIEIPKILLSRERTKNEIIRKIRIK